MKYGVCVERRGALKDEVEWCCCCVELVVPVVLLLLMGVWRAVLLSGESALRMSSSAHH